jgi:ABC-2 type transport system ATP-binding protein
MIETEGLTRKFGEVTAMDHLTLHVNDGEVFGFLGPNWAGKTAAVRMLCCLISRTSGTARIAGHEVGNGYDSVNIMKIVGAVPENVGLYEGVSAYGGNDTPKGVD